MVDHTVNLGLGFLLIAASVVAIRMICAVIVVGWLIVRALMKPRDPDDRHVGPRRRPATPPATLPTTLPVAGPRCSACGGALAAGSLEGLCPRCLLRAGIEESDAPRSLATAAYSPGFTPPTVQELSGHFP